MRNARFILLVLFAISIAILVAEGPVGPFG